MEYEVTIGMPVYNAERYIRRAVESVLSQTFGSIELLICDDCGTDTSIDIIREYQSHHQRGGSIRIVRQPVNKGVGEGRNLLIDSACGHYIYFMDADDTIAPDAIEKLYAQAAEHGAEAVYGSHVRVEELGGQVKSRPVIYPYKVFSAEDEFASWVYDEYGRTEATTWNILIDVSVFRRNGIRYKAVNFWEDFSTTIDLPTYITRAVMLPDITYYYYCRSGTLSNYDQRDHIAKDEIQKTIGVMAKVKAASGRVKAKPYFHKRMYKVMMTHFYMACSILKYERIISPPFTKREIRDVMRSPLSLSETLRLRGWGWRNLALYLLGVLPPAVSVAVIRALGRRKGLI